MRVELEAAMSDMVLRTCAEQWRDKAPSREELLAPAPAEQACAEQWVQNDWSGLCHRILAGPPLDKSQWTTSCGWRFGSASTPSTLRSELPSAAGKAALICARCAPELHERSRKVLTSAAEARAA